MLSKNMYSCSKIKQAMTHFSCNLSVTEQTMLSTIKTATLNQNLNNSQSFRWSKSIWCLFTQISKFKSSQISIFIYNICRSLCFQCNHETLTLDKWTQHTFAASWGHEETVIMAFIKICMSDTHEYRVLSVLLSGHFSPQTSMESSGERSTIPYSLNMASGLARMALTTQVMAMTRKQVSFDIRVSRW